jgi:SAM-dependent methyltransferase
MNRQQIAELLHEDLDIYKHMPAKQGSFLTTFSILEKHRINLSGKSVLEIGTDAKLICANYFLKRGASRVTTCNMKVDGIDLSRNTSGRIELMRCDASKQVFSAKFDVIFGRAILEHIPDIEGFLRSVDSSLAPGGFLYLDGGPMWDSPLGYHLWFSCSSGKRYTMADESKVIGPWEHLLLGRDELVAAIENRGVAAQDATEIAKYVHDSPDQNRASCEEIERIFRQSDSFSFDFVYEGYTHPPQEVIDKLGSKAGNNQMIIIGKKKRKSLASRLKRHCF